jgi:hypothetical protein
MGLFDYIQCEYPLPLPKESEGWTAHFSKGVKAPVDWSEFEFQTKSLGNGLQSFVISEDGVLYEEIGTRKGLLPYTKVEVESIEKIEYTGELSFYGLHLEEKLDHWLEFKGLFWKGEMKELTLVELKSEDNSERIEFTEKIVEAQSKLKKDSKTSLYKIKSIYTWFVRGILFCIRWTLGFIVKTTWKIERWIT